MVKLAPVLIEVHLLKLSSVTNSNGIAMGKCSFEVYTYICAVSAFLHRLGDFSLDEYLGPS